MRTKKSDYHEAKQLLKRIENQDKLLRKINGEGEGYKDLTKGKYVKVYMNDKKAMKFWEE